MKRIQFYPDDKLDSRLSAKSTQLGISVAALVTDLLNQIDFDNVLKTSTSSTYSFAKLYSDVREDIMNYVNDPESKKEFVLNDIPAFQKINLAKAETAIIQPASTRAIVGRTFNAEVRNGKIPQVVRATTTDKHGQTVLKFIAKSAVYVIVN
jgi:hypothetical protein